MLFATCLTRIRKLIPLTVFLGIAVNAQPDGGSISGEVGEATTGRPMAGVSVFVEGFPGGDTSDKKGEFRITRVPEGQYTLVLSFLGFATVQREGILVKNGQVTRLDKILMAERPIPLNEIVVSPGSYSVMGEHTSPRQTLSNEDIRIMGWAEDVTRAVQRIPGTTSDEFSAQFSIRGGDVDEVLVLLDGMQIYKPFHQKDFGGGLFSTIDIEVIEGVDLLTGGFAANYGNRMSGVLNMKSKTPAADQQLTSVGLSLMNARLFTMGNFGNNRGNYLFSARRGYLDLVNRLMNNEFKLEPKYYDLFGKTSWQLNRRHFLSLYGFHADDAYRLDERVVEPNTTWTNIDDRTSSYANSYAWANLKSSLRDNLFVETLAYGGRVSQHRIWEQFDLDPAAHLNSADINGKRVFDLAGLKQTWNLTLHPRLLFNLGGEFKGLRTDYDYSQSIRNELIVPGDSLTLQTREITFRDRISGNQIGAFLAGRFQVAAPLTLEAGLRYDDASYTGDRLWSPRVGMVLGLSPSTFLRAGWGYYYQMQNIDDLDIQFGDFAFHPAEKAEHLVVGLEQNFANGLLLRLEGYRKNMSDLRDRYFAFRDIDEFFPEARDDLVRLKVKGAVSRGLEVMLKKGTGERFSWLMSYVLADVRDDVEQIFFEGQLIKPTGWVPRQWDQRHTFNLDANYRLSHRWQFSMAWQMRSGWPDTDFTVKRLQREDGSYAYFEDRGEFRGVRLPAYQRLDLRVNRIFRTTRGTISTFLQVINLYNHENIIRYDYDILSVGENGFEAGKAAETWFGIMPFAGFSWEF